MTPDPAAPAAPSGRRVVLTPVPQGLWLVIGGVVIATLAPLFGFLVGSMIGSDESGPGDLSARYLCLMLGIVVGGVGVLMVLLGARRLIRHGRTGSGG